MVPHETQGMIKKAHVEGEGLMFVHPQTTKRIGCMSRTLAPTGYELHRADPAEVNLQRKPEVTIVDQILRKPTQGSATKQLDGTIESFTAATSG